MVKKSDAQNGLQKWTPNPATPKGAPTVGDLFNVTGFGVQF